ncbi:YdcF family protein [Desulfomarina profundi]|nr:ElyC/SanA/YdcF family protein [Desulfomarina profundi]
MPLSSQLGDDSLKRLIEAIVIYNQNPGSKLILSGAPPEDDPVSNAEMMARLAEALNVPRSDIAVMPDPTNTMEEARLLKPLLSGKKFVLVTSAFHMTRALKLFTAQGLNPIPAPVDFKILSRVPFSLKPSAKALQTSQIAIHEYLGLAWAWIKKKLT